MIKEKYSSKKVLTTFVVSGVTIFAVLFLFVFPKLEVVPSGLPAYLIIKKINLNAPVESVGFLKNKEMGVPKKITDVGWFSLGTLPGSIGTAVMDGHYGFEGGRASAFDRLIELEKGDIVSVKDDRGNVINFSVREIKTYDLKSDTKDVFVSNDGESHLNLITCAGEWNVDKKVYTSRLVVFTDKLP